MPENNSSIVWGVDAAAYSTSGGMVRALDGLLDKSGLKDIFKPNDYVGIKINVGELGNVRYLRPVLVRSIVEKVTELGGIPVIMDTVGMVGNTLRGPNDWFYTTSVNGYPGALLGKDVIPADGYTGAEGELLPIDGDELGGVEVARGVVEVAAMVVVSHVTGHPFFGLNGALFNKGVGCSAQKGKWRIFNPLKPVVDTAKCNNCADCIALCPTQAITANNGAAKVDHNRCKGCNHYCLDFCSQRALTVEGESYPRFQKRVVEAATAVNVATMGKLFYLNFLLDVGKYPDYYTVSDQSITPDLGILASKDPVAIDQASLDLINKAPGLVYQKSRGYRMLAPDSPKFEEIHGVDTSYPLQYAEDFGLGLRKYNLEMIGG
ncbi:MAG: DUF362 domain-containing protein [Eubacteriales bacterium]